MQIGRRRLVIGGLELAAFASVASRTSAAGLAGIASRSAERALVVVQLSGANDGLNTVVPHRQDAYYRARPVLGLSRQSLHALDDAHGLHPEAAGLAELYAQGRLAVVHGVGYPEPNRSHFRSMEIWHSADPLGPVGPTGWLGRVADRLAEANGSAMLSLHVGSEVLPLALQGERWFAPSVRDPRGFRLTTRSRAHADARLDLISARAPGDLGFLRDAARATYGAAERMQQLAEAGAAAEYPSHELAQKLRLVARLVTGGFGTRVYYLQHDGYDTHARQAPAHAALLGELSGALSAFQRDLAQHGESEHVLVLVFSEFGRRVEENGSKGTDHGAGAPLFLLGGRVRGGMHGTAPDLARLVDGDVPHGTDFRAIYASIESEWFGLANTQTSAPLRGLLG
jgi:uncharacterized protein (DUF1501 family)